MNKICTDIPQSKRLIELGIDVDTSDMVYLRSYFEDEGEYNLLVGSYHEGYMEKDDGTLIPVFDEHIPAWSLSALMNLLPSEFTEVGKYSKTTYNIHIRKYALSENVDLHQIAYGNYKWHEDGEYTWSDMVNTGEKENLIDAAFEMICWLKENNKI